MNEEVFVQKKDASWQRLYQLCDKAEASPANLTPDELEEFIRAYRQASADLALVRTQSSNLQLIDFLNDLTGRCYAQLYRPPRGSVRSAIATGVALAAQTARRSRIFLLVSAIIFFGSALFASVIETVRPDTRPFLVPAGFDSQSKAWQEGKHEERSGSEGIGASAFYATNNPFVAILGASIAAATFGVGTTVILYSNGTILGVLANDMASVGKLGFLLASIAPHGVTEISGMVFSGAGGLMMGWALVNPGRRRRGEALLAAGKDAVVMICISVVLMFMAAPIEGFISFNPTVPSPVKVVFALCTAIAWTLFWVGYGRSDEGKVNSATQSAH